MRGSIHKTIRSRELRTNQTDAETKLWNRLRNRQLAGHKFVRQLPIGRYVCDFVCRERLLIIEAMAASIQIRSAMRFVISTSGRRAMA